MGSEKEERDRMDENELTPEEEMAFQNLPREAEPSRVLEERVVKSLRDDGVLGRRSAPRVISHTPAMNTRGYRPWMVAASVAASLVLFASGVAMGQWMGAESTAQAFIQVREQDAAQLALRIQEAGSAYVSALSALSELRLVSQSSEGGDPEGGVTGMDLEQGREVALGALYGAANELARLSPDDRDVLRVLQILEERQGREEGWGGSDRNVVWF